MTRPKTSSRPRSTHGTPVPATLLWLFRAALFAIPIAIALTWLARQLARDGEPAFPMDDPYIHLQFARNLATGHGFAFNPGEPTPGATSPLWVVVLALGHMLGAPLVPLALALGVLLAGLTSALTFDVGIAAGLPLSFAALAALAVAACGRTAWAALSGMEIELAAALSLLLVRVQLARISGTPRALLLGALAGLAANARPEMALLGPLVAALEAWRAVRAGEARSAPRQAALLLAAFVALLLPYLSFCLVSAGRPFPNTYYAKGVIGRALDPDLRQSRAAYIPELFLFLTHDNAFLTLLLVPGLVMVLVRPARRRAWLLALWPLAFWIYALAVVPRHFSASRYTIPLIPALALVAVEPLAWVWARFPRPVAQGALIGAAALLIAMGAVDSQKQYAPFYRANVENILHMQVRAGRWVAEHVPRQDRVATNDVGAITFYGGRRCIDTVGLVDSDLITRLLAALKRGGDVDVQAVLASYLGVARPSYCILFPGWYPDLARAPWLRYVAEFDYPNSTGGENRLVAFRVVGTPR